LSARVSRVLRGKVISLLNIPPPRTAEHAIAVRFNYFNSFLVHNINVQV
jgi:hypothetical protein